MIVKHKASGKVIIVTQGHGFFGNAYYKGFFEGKFVEFKYQDLDLNYKPSLVEACELFEAEALTRYDLEGDKIDLTQQNKSYEARTAELLDSLKNRHEQRRYEIARDFAPAIYTADRAAYWNKDYRTRSMRDYNEIADFAVSMADELLKALNDDTDK